MLPARLGDRRLAVSRARAARALVAVFARIGVSALVACAEAGPSHPGAYQGVVELEERIVGAEVPGRLVALAVERGDAVTSDQVVAEIDHAVADATRLARAAEVEVARAQLDLLVAGTRREDLDQIAAQVRAARAAERLLELALERARRLLAEEAAPASTVDQYAGQVDRARAERQALEERAAGLRHGARREEVDGARARLAAAVAALAIEDRALERHRLRAPIAGVVVDVVRRAGETVAAGAAVLTVADPAHPYVDVFVPEGEVTGLAIGGAARATVDGGDTWRGAIEHIASATEFTPRFVFSERERPNLVVRVRVRIDDPARGLRAGLPAFVTLARAGAPAGAP
jgi:HlyD family secretion protein